MPYQATNGLELRHQLSNAVAGAIDTPRSLRAQIIPLSNDGHSGRSQAVKVENYDQHGIKFQHPLPLHDRRVLVFLEGISLGRMAAEVDLSWCRFTRAGQYTSGGRFVQLVGQSA